MEWILIELALSGNLSDCNECDIFTLWFDNKPGEQKVNI